MQGLGRGQAGQAEQGGQQRVGELAEVMGPATPLPGEHQPDQTEHQGGQPALAAIEVTLQAQALRISQQADQRRGAGRLHKRIGSQYTEHEDRAPDCGFSNLQAARSSLLVSTQSVISTLAELE